MRMAGHSLNIQAASADKVRNRVVPINVGTASGSALQALDEIMAAARDTGAVPMININNPEPRFEKEETI